MISREFVTAFRHFFRFPLQAIFIAIQIFVSLLVSYFALLLIDNLWTQVSSTQAAVGISRTEFSSYESNELGGGISAQARANLRKLLDGNHLHHSFLILPADDHFNVSSPVLVGIGGFASFNKLSTTSLNTPIVFIGANVTEIKPGDRLTYGSTQIPVAHRLPRGASYLGYFAGLPILDNSIVVNFPYADFVTATKSGRFFESMMTHLTLVDYPPAQVDELVREISETPRHRIIPRPGTPAGWRSLETSSLITLAVLGLFLLLSHSALLLTLSSLWKQSRRDLAIDILYGARWPPLLLRVFLYLGTLFALPTASLFYYLGPSAFTFYPKTAFGLLLGILVYLLALTSVAGKKLSRLNSAITLKASTQ